MGFAGRLPNIDSVSQAIKHNVTGFIYKSNAPESAASYIEELASNKKLRLGMGNAAKAKADSTYNFEQCTKTFIYAINKIYLHDL